MIGPPELIAILIAALFLFGPQKLPELARSLGGAIGEFKKAQRAAELELTQFDAYTRKAGNKVTPGEKEKEKEKQDIPGSSKEIKTNRFKNLAKIQKIRWKPENPSLDRKSPEKLKYRDQTKIKGDRSEEDRQKDESK